VCLRQIVRTTTGEKCEYQKPRLNLPNVKDEPRPWLARLVLLGAQGVTARVVGSSAWLGGFLLRILRGYGGADASFL